MRDLKYFCVTLGSTHVYVYFEYLRSASGSNSQKKNFVQEINHFASTRVQINSMGVYVCMCVWPI